MADHTLKPPARAVHAQLVAGVEDTITVPAGAGRVSLVLHPADPVPVWVTTGDQPAEVGGAHCQVLFPSWSGELTIPSGLLAGLDGAGDLQAGTVRLISDTPCPYSLEVG